MENATAFATLVRRSLVLFVALFGAVALITGFWKHRRAAILFLMLGGLACISGAAWFGAKLPSHKAERGITFVASALMIAAPRPNHTFCRSCECSRGR
jgi:hypothetical protein